MVFMDRSPVSILCSMEPLEPKTWERSVRLNERRSRKDLRAFCIANNQIFFHKNEGFPKPEKFLSTSFLKNNNPWTHVVHDQTFFWKHRGQDWKWILSTTSIFFGNIVDKLSCPKRDLHKPLHKWTKRTIKKQPDILLKQYDAPLELWSFNFLCLLTFGTAGAENANSLDYQSYPSQRNFL